MELTTVGEIGQHCLLAASGIMVLGTLVVSWILAHHVAKGSESWPEASVKAMLCVFGGVMVALMQVALMIGMTL